MMYLGKVGKKEFCMSCEMENHVELVTSRESGKVRFKINYDTDSI
jgi:ribosomal protein S26